jgi:hypothetical protein
MFQRDFHGLDREVTFQKKCEFYGKIEAKNRLWKNILSVPQSLKRKNTLIYA